MGIFNHSFGSDDNYSGDLPEEIKDAPGGIRPLILGKGGCCRRATLSPKPLSSRRGFQTMDDLGNEYLKTRTQKAV